MQFTGKEDHQISLEEAIKLVKNFKNKVGEEVVKAHFIGKEAILKVLDQENCVGVRIYYAENDEGKPELVVVGVNENGKDLVEGLILERTWPCPPYCDGESKLIQ